MFNQKRWRPGKFISANECERCQCFGHADECFFDPQVFNLIVFKTKSENIINLGAKPQNNASFLLSSFIFRNSDTKLQKH
jgi:hypothetical protein